MVVDLMFHVVSFASSQIALAPSYYSLLGVFDGLWGYGELESLGLYLLDSLDTPLLDSLEFPTAVKPGTPEEPLVKLKLVLDDSAI